MTKICVFERKAHKHTLAKGKISIDKGVLLKMHKENCIATV